MASLLRIRIYLLAGFLLSFWFFAALQVKYYPESPFSSVFTDGLEVRLTRCSRFQTGTMI
jgi:hypothetical protein